MFTVHYVPSFALASENNQLCVIKDYELPKAEEVSAYKEKLERVHLEFNTSTK
jgi:hypothetical protein